jgi:hypothetical protein
VGKLPAKEAGGGQVLPAACMIKSATYTSQCLLHDVHVSLFALQNSVHVCDLSTTTAWELAFRLLIGQQAYRRNDGEAGTVERGKKAEWRGRGRSESEWQ